MLPQSWDIDKPFVDFDLQIKRLIRRGLSMNPAEEEEALKLIKAHGYYQLVNGYGKPFELSASNGEKCYKEGTKFSDIYSQFYLDHELGRILFQYMLDIEEHFKNAIAYTVSKYFGVNNYWKNDEVNPLRDINSYLDMSFYPNQPTAILDELHELSLTETKNPTAYYREHSNHIPPWILFMNVTLGTINRYYQILPTKMKIEVINEMLPEKMVRNNFADGNKGRHIFFNGFELMREFRNCVAHGSRFYSHRSKSYPLSMQLRKKVQYRELYSNSEHSSGTGERDLYALLIWLVLCSQDDLVAKSMVSDINSFFSNTLTNFPSAKEPFFNECHLPEDFIARLNYLIEAIY